MANYTAERIKEAIWNEVVFDNKANITNIANASMGNQGIVGNLYDYLEDHTPDYVYLQFSGLTRYDMPVDSKFTAGNVRKGYKRSWFCTGGRRGSWLRDVKSKHTFLPLYFVENYTSHIERQSLQSVSSAINLLERKGIKYNWTFYYNVLKPANITVLENDGKIQKWPNYIDRSKMIDTDPHTFCNTTEWMKADGVHFTNEGYKEWLLSIKEQLTI